MAVLLRVFGIDPDHLEEGYYCMTGAAGCYIDSKNAKCPDWGYAPRNRIISDGGSTTTIAVEVAFSQDNESLCDKMSRLLNGAHVTAALGMKLYYPKHGTAPGNRYEVRGSLLLLLLIDWFVSWLIECILIGLMD